MSETFITRAGCRITVERVGPSIGVTIHPKDGKATLYACGADEACDVANMLAPPDTDLIASIKREARAKALEEAAEESEQDATPHRPGPRVAAWLRDRAARERRGER